MDLDHSTDLELLQFQCWDLEQERDEALAKRDDAWRERDEVVLLLHESRLETATCHQDAASAAKFMQLATQHLKEGFGQAA